MNLTRAYIDQKNTFKEDNEVKIAGVSYVVKL